MMSQQLFPKKVVTQILTIKAPIMTAAEDKFCDIFPNFRKKIRYYISRESSAILMKYHALFVIFEKAAKFVNVLGGALSVNLILWEDSGSVVECLT